MASHAIAALLAEPLQGQLSKGNATQWNSMEDTSWQVRLYEQMPVLSSVKGAAPASSHSTLCRS